MPRLYHVYIVTNVTRSVLYTGMNNNMKARLIEHFLGLSGFTSRYNIHYLLYYETTKYVLNALPGKKRSKVGREKRSAT
jgi:putative endonuclease